MIGDEAAKARRLLELSHPLEEGIIKNWDDMELIWRYGFEEKVYNSNNNNSSTLKLKVQVCL
jgi:actin-related protein 2